MSATHNLSPLEQEILHALQLRRPELESCLPGLLKLHETLVRCYDASGMLFTCGNGGSHGDAAHIVGELLKSFERRRPLPDDVADNLQGLPYGEQLADHLESGLRAHTLGLNGPLKTAVENDVPVPNIAFAQELNALSQPGDVLLAVSTSGNAENCLMAMSVAKARGGVAVALTGPKGGKMAAFGDIVIKAPGDSTKVVQEAHIAIWHTMCLLIEAHYFPEMRG